MKKVFVLTAFAALFTFVACEKNAVEPLSIADETSVSTDIADVETPDAFARETVAESRGSFKIASITPSRAATATSGDAGCTNYKYKGYATNGSSFNVICTGDLGENIANVEGAITNLSMRGKLVTFNISMPSDYTFGSTTVIFTTGNGTRISKTIKVVNVREGLFYGSSAYGLRFLSGISAARLASSGEAITSATAIPSAGNILVVSGKKAVVVSYAVGKIIRGVQSPNKCTYSVWGESCNSGQKSISWTGTSRFPTGTSAIVR
jgi:hypothetical protein